MHKVYTPSLRRIAQNTGYWLVFTGLVVWFTRDRLGQLRALVLGGLVVLAMLWTFWTNWTTISIENGILRVKTNSSETFYELKNYTFRAYTTQSGANIDCVFYLDEPSGREHRIECEMLGIFQFEEIIGQLQEEMKKHQS